VDRVGEAFVWPFRDPDGVTKILVVGLILLIPIVGAINSLGWMLAALHRLRAGEERLPPANFDHLGRGFRLFVVFLVYYLVLTAAAAAVYLPAILLLAEQGRQESSNPFLVLLGLAMSLLAFSVVTLGSILMTFLTPAIILQADGGGIAAGLRVAEVVRRARASLTSTLVAGLMLIAASLVAQLGIVVCVVGVVFTAAYAFAMQAWIVRSYELGPTHN
jgi:uncharacterized protein DUF4013